MNRKKYIIASVVAALVMYAADFVLHVLILGSAYKENAGLFASNEQMMKWMWLSPIAYLSLAFLMGYIFIKGYEGKGLMEGVRFGIIMGALMSIPRFCFEVMYYNYPKIFDISNLIGGLVIFTIMGVIYAAIYKPESKTN